MGVLPWGDWTGAPSRSLPTLFVRLSSVAFLAQHLAVACYRPPAFRPRRDMVGIHLLYLEMPAAGGADALLPLIHLPPRVAIKGADAEAMRT